MWVLAIQNRPKIDIGPTECATQIFSGLLSWVTPDPAVHISSWSGQQLYWGAHLILLGGFTKGKESKSELKNVMIEYIFNSVIKVD